MGATLSSRIEWTSASDKGGKLDFNKSNEELLLQILKYLEVLYKEHPREAAVLFKRPFVWNSSLPLSQFSSLSSQGYLVSDNGVVSTSEGDDGQPHLKISKNGNDVEIQASTFKELYNVVDCAGEKRLREVQLCLEANPDPTAVIMGAGYSQASSSSSTLLEIHERLAREKAKGNGGGSVDELDSSFRLLLLINDLDIKLLHSSVKQMGQEVRLTPEAVSNEMDLLIKLCGKAGEGCLKSISYTSDLVFSNGCRAPPWRQVRGDICYIQLECHDVDPFYITASTEGYYVNKGLTDSGDVDGDIDSDRMAEVSTTLVGIIKKMSKDFETSINKKEFLYMAEEDPKLDKSENTEKFFDAMDMSFSQRDRTVQVSVDEHAQEDTYHDESADNINMKRKKSIGRDPSSKQKDLVVQHSSPFRKNTGPSNGSVAPRSRGTRQASQGGLESRRGNSNFSKSAATANVSLGSKRKSASTRSRKSAMDGSVYHQEILDSDSSSEDSEVEENQDRRPESTSDHSSEYWHVQKLLKHVRAGNPTSTVISLCTIMDQELWREELQMAIRDAGGLDLLINVLETNDIKCKIGTLRILHLISKSTTSGMALVDHGGVPILVNVLRSPNRCLKCLAAETIANVARFKRARRQVRQNGGIKKLVSLLENPGRPSSPISGERSDLDVAKSAAQGLWSCSKSKRNKIALLKTGAVPLLGKLLSTTNEDVLIPVVGTLQECASERGYQELIRSEGMIEHLVRGLKTKNPELQQHCASAIFKCAEESVTQSLVKEHGGLEPLASLLKGTDKKDLLCAVTGAVWKCSKSAANVIQFKNLKAVEQLVSLLSNMPEEVLVNVVGAIGECAAKDADVRMTIRKAGGVTPLVQLLTGTNQALLINTTKAVGACALEPESMIVIDRQDGVRLLWSLLKSPNPEVQACAAWAICPCIQNAKDAGELVRSFVGGLELIVGLLKSEDPEVLAGVCAAIAQIAQDEENLGVITDHGVVLLLAKLTETYDDTLRKNLADAIARCCMWRNNRVAFGEAAAVAPLVSYLKSQDKHVHRSTACALYQLSKDPNNCITMHEAGVVQPLLTMVSSSDEVLQEAAAGCINSIRQLALANEKAKFK